MDWVYRHERKSPDDALQLLLDVTPQDVNEVLSHNPFDHATVVALGPLDGLEW
jgi:hypothetical protein